MFTCKSASYYVIFKNNAFLETHLEIKIGLSKFCSLRSKWCITCFSSGTHSVYVCTYAQNAVLLTSAACINENCKDLMGHVVCNTENKLCMVRRCCNCPGRKALDDFLHTVINEDIKAITYQEWEVADRCTMRALLTPPSEFVDILADAIEKLTAHSCISKCQS